MSLRVATALEALQTSVAAFRVAACAAKLVTALEAVFASKEHWNEGPALEMDKALLELKGALAEYERIKKGPA